MSSPSWTTVAAPVRSSSAGMVSEDGKARWSGMNLRPASEGASQGIFGAHISGEFNAQRHTDLFALRARLEAHDFGCDWTFDLELLDDTDASVT